MEKEETLSLWKTHSIKIITGTILMVLAGVVGALCDTLVFSTTFCHYCRETLNVRGNDFVLLIRDLLDVPTAFREYLIADCNINLDAINIIAKIILFVGFCLFLIGLTKLSNLTTDSKSKFITIRNSFVCVATAVLLNWLLSYTSIAGMFSFLLMWLVAIPSFWICRKRYKQLNTESEFGLEAQNGFDDLKWSMSHYLYYVTVYPAIFIASTLLMRFWLEYWMSQRVNSYLYVDALGYSITGHSTGIDNLMKEGKDMEQLIIIIACCFGIVFILDYIVSMIINIRGWNRIRKGGLKSAMPEDVEVKTDETDAETNEQKKPSDDESKSSLSAKWVTVGIIGFFCLIFGTWYFTRPSNTGKYLEDADVEFVELTMDSVKIYVQPQTDAPYLLCGFHDEGGDGVPFYVWNNDRDAIRAHRNDGCSVYYATRDIYQQTDKKDGWVKIKIPYTDNIEGWIETDYCIEKKPLRMTLEMMQQDTNRVDMLKPMRMSGAFAGKSLYYEGYESDAEQVIGVCELKEGVVLQRFSGSGYFEEKAPLTKPMLEMNKYGYRAILYLGSNCVLKSGFGFDTSKLSDEEFKEVTDKLVKNDETLGTYYFFERQFDSEEDKEYSSLYNSVYVPAE